jgi:predicted O-linked N-acetylglucosamine transferase (SPINDLY family)
MPDDIADLLNAAARSHRAGDLPRAARLYDDVLARAPDQPEALHLRGLVAAQTGDAARAEALIRRAIELKPADPTFHNNLGELYRRGGRNDEAIRCYLRAVEIAPAFPDVHYNLGIALDAAGRAQEAIESYLRAVQHRPQYAKAWYNLANLFLREGRLERSIEAYRHVLAIDPGHADAHINLGNALKEHGEIERAIEHYREALRGQPDNADLPGNLAQAYGELGRWEDARAAYRETLARRPEDWLAALRIELLGHDVPADAAEIDASRAAVVDAVERVVPSDRALAAERLHSSCVEPPMRLVYHGRDDLDIKIRYAARFQPLIRPLAPVPGSGPPHVGVVVTHGHEGVFLKCMRGVLEHIDTARVKVTVVCSRAGGNILRQKLRNPALGYLALPPEVPAAAAAIRAAGIELLHYWEVGTDSMNYFLPFHRPAAVQCATWGWPVTTGIPAVDCFVSSEPLEPEGAQAHYSERLVRLPSLPVYYYRPALPARLKDRAAFGLGDDERVYLCIQNVRKIQPDLDAAIGGILRRDRGGRFVFLSVKQRHLAQRLLDRLRRGIPDVVDRVTVLEQMPEPDYLNLIAVADVVLDTFHYGGGANTTYDTFSTGTPIVTLPGAFHRGRWAAAAYRRIGVTDAIAASPEEYVDIAVALANDPDRRADLSRRIKEEGATLFEDIRPVRELEDFFVETVTAARKR